MALFLVEATLNESGENKSAVEAAVATLHLDEGKLIEVQVASDFKKVYVIVEANKEEEVQPAFSGEAFTVQTVKEVRIVGQELEDVKKNAGQINYLVEWNFPADLTMDQYLARKKKNSVHYAEVPEVEFQRTYVCEDMTKCLCFYDAPDDDAVKRAREAVSAPVSSITKLSRD
ncbi:DUF4242 domain-containing protein [Geomicrobium sp. JCM 19039]|uniref:DUF4242 domain-containing protein n=1 Tax=Geomicrobium sp. JCM 19039 TaxID=1460636 RepID=UPI00045F1943|nr:DUF4242 domain-containing protein [Geomicrobium sp. JCM 19039]GAK13068.1 hypothetical protein JCM19039_2885 [Geomicrobium sp. JCM 19039]